MEYRECPDCGFAYRQGLESNEEQHALIHDEWMFGARFPREPADRLVQVIRGLELLEAAAQDADRYKRRFWDVALRARRGTDFPTPYDGSGEAEWDGRAFVLRRDDRSVGFCVLRRRGRAWWWEWSDYDAGRAPGDADATVRRWLDFAWVLPSLQGKGLGSEMVRAAARRLGTATTDLGWTLDFTPAGERLARRLTATGFWAGR